MVRILVGADPELFVRDRKTGEIVSAHDLIPGTKLEPYKVPLGAIQVDGAAAEFNIDPASDATSFITNIKTVMNELKDRMKDVDFILDPTVTFKEKYFYSLPEETRELGCNPDFNAWTGQVNPAPEGSKTTMRTASGHIHVGWCDGVNPMDPMHFKDCCTVVKQLDYYLGIYSLKWDPDPNRRQLYGKAGSFRPKSYGVEYRTMSNVWLRSQSVQTWIYHAVQAAVDSLTTGQSMEDQFGDWARTVIDTGEINWDKTTKGVLVHSKMFVSFPDYKSCLKEEKPQSTSGKSHKKVRAKKSYDIVHVDENALGWNIPLQEVG